MLRITTIANGITTTLRLEGRLVGDWVDELERCCTGPRAADPTRKIEIDASDVEFLDEKGEALLERLYLNGAKLRGGNPYMESIVADIVERSNQKQLHE